MKCKYPDSEFPKSAYIFPWCIGRVGWIGLGGCPCLWVFDCLYMGVFLGLCVSVFVCVWVRVSDCVTGCCRFVFFCWGWGGEVGWSRYQYLCICVFVENMHYILLLLKRSFLWQFHAQMVPKPSLKINILPWQTNKQTNKQTICQCRSVSEGGGQKISFLRWRHF